MIDSAGQLGTVSSSIRFKEDIHDMADASRRLLKLRPVTFRYTQAYIDGAKPIQYGLIAEEVAEVFPELAVRGADGRVETVHYETLNVLLVNEVQKQQQRIEALEQKLDELTRPARAITVRCRESFFKKRKTTPATGLDSVVNNPQQPVRTGAAGAIKGAATAASRHDPVTGDTTDAAVPSAGAAETAA